MNVGSVTQVQQLLFAGVDKLKRARGDPKAADAEEEGEDALPLERVFKVRRRLRRRARPCV